MKRLSITRKHWNEFTIHTFSNVEYLAFLHYVFSKQTSLKVSFVTAPQIFQSLVQITKILAPEWYEAHNSAVTSKSQCYLALSVGAYKLY
jgi:hypothetical protein